MIMLLVVQVLTIRVRSPPQQLQKNSNAQGITGNGTGTDTDTGIDEGIEIKIPLSLLMTGTSAGSNECSVIVQVTPQDAPTMDFHGAGGAVGRFEVNDDTVTMDLKGFQYQGALQAGPTCIIASMHPLIGENIIKVESITDEFVTLQQTGDQLAQLDAVVEKGSLDDSFIVRDHNVNSRDRGSNANPNDDADKGKKKAVAKNGKETKPSKRKRK